MQENASRHLLKKFLTSAVASGTGKTKNAFNAQATGSSTIREFAFPSLINARLSISLEVAFLATMATTWLEENVLKLPSRKLLTSAVVFGTGKI